MLVITYSREFRQKVFAKKAKLNLTCEEVSGRFDISIKTLFRWQLTLEPCTTRNKPATKLNIDQLADVEAYPDVYHRGRTKRLGVTERTISDGLKRLGITYKKNTQAPKNRRRSTHHIPI